jgi:hypothetical protein
MLELDVCPAFAAFKIFPPKCTIFKRTTRVHSLPKLLGWTPVFILLFQPNAMANPNSNTL